MRLVIDTHTFLWFIQDDPHLSKPALSLLASDADVVLSVASLWEIAVKVNIGKLFLPDSFDAYITRQLSVNDIELLPISVSHLHRVTHLPFHHRDPFDRLIIAQALVEDIPLVGADSVFDRYGVGRRW